MSAKNRIRGGKGRDEWQGQGARSTFFVKTKVCKGPELRGKAWGEILTHSA